MKDYGNLIPWLPEPNPTYRRAQIKRAFRIDLGKMLQPAQQNPDDFEVPYLRAANVQWNRLALDDIATMWASPPEIEALRLCQGDLLVCEGGEVGRAARVDVPLPENCIIQNALHRVRGNELGDVGFMEYCLRSAADKGWFEVLCNRATIAHFTGEKFREMWIYLPPLLEQQSIAEYLDREVAHIDALVAEKERMLALLEDKRAVLISSAVTRGLNPKAITKPSGLDWLGDIPKHWGIDRGKNLFAVRDQRSEDGEEELLTVSHITGVTSRTEKEVYMFKADDMTGYKRCMKDDFVTNTLWAWMGAMGVSPLDGIVSPDYHVYTSKGQILPEFMELLCRSKPFVAEVIRWSKGVWSSRLRLYPENFFEIRFPVPPQDEQEAIVAEIAAYRKKTAELSEALGESIKLLKERRSALITAAVTGKIAIPA